MDREVYRVTKYLRDKMADYIYNGFWFSPEAEFVRKCLTESQKNVTGKVVVDIYKGNGKSEDVFNFSNQLRIENEAFE